MGLWGEHILPRLVDRALRTPEVDERRALVCAGLSGRVLEVGFGSGLNLRHLPEAVTEVLAIEPSEVARRLAAHRIAAARIPVTVAGLDGQAIDLPDGAVDAALSTFTLCTIPDLPGALAEIRRVLRPGGALHFLEHGRAPDAEVLRWQLRLDPLQGRLIGGCHLTRQIDRLVAAAGFELSGLATGYGTGARPFSYLYRGLATRPAV